ncbi:unnamed protein product [Acanthoscelides obtectus]|uniref:PAS domain-containing protein n=1 Tax=Acanthoscelides obtectus TaxID=200917 RepID=A0A9P0P684_ACAOB|nr:unnamed protein product [Acanthoscelides obtectus]CAK1645427.1 Aryl hydrocarbon receptor nuclear translocator-like protein 1 [Acanthoscelides obtectus]
MILVFFVKVCRPEPLLDRLIEASKDEYVTRHLIDGRIINCDQRISIIAGYMTEEVAGNSAFKYMHRDDVRWVIIALRQMYDRGESRGSSCYRLQSRNGQFIFLRTFGFLEIDDQGTVESFVCINTMVSESEGMHLINEMKKRYSALINTALPSSNLETLTPPSSNDSSVDLVEDPAEVEQAVSHLMHNLPSPVVTPIPREHRNAKRQESHTEVHRVITTGATTVTVMQHRHGNQRQEGLPVPPSGNKPFQIKMNAAIKRPPEPDATYGTGKRVKTPLQQLSPQHTLLHNAALIADIKQDQQQQPTQPSQPDRVYKHDNLLRQNI